MSQWQKSKRGLLLDLFTDGHIHSLNTGSTGDDGNFIGFVRHIIDLEEADRETMHLLVFLLMQFLSRSEQVAVLYLHVNFTSLYIILCNIPFQFL
jgi:hypothetical protein